MRVNSIPIGLFCLSLLWTMGLAADERTDAAHFEQLVRQVERAIPPGWSVSFNLVNPDNPNRRGASPAIMIQSNDPLPVEHFYPGRAARSPGEAPKVSQEKATVYFVASPFLSPEQYPEAQKHNNALLQTRTKFQNEQLKGIPRAYKGPEPIPPDAFEPRNDEEAQQVRQYAFLWISTEPKPLPTHFAKNLSFTMDSPGPMKIHDAPREKEYKQVVEDIQKIIAPYETSH